MFSVTGEKKRRGVGGEGEGGEKKQKEEEKRKKYGNILKVSAAFINLYTQTDIYFLRNLQLLTSKDLDSDINTVCYFFNSLCVLMWATRLEV